MDIRQRSRAIHCLFLTAAVITAWHAPANAQTTVPLGTADSFAVLAGAGITNTGATNITGNVGSFPTTSQTGFGTVTLNGANNGGNAITQQAKNDLVTAYNNAAGRPATVTYAPVSDLGGLTLASGVYKNPTSFGLTGILTLNGGGNANSVWIFQAGSTLTTAAGSSVRLINGAQACMVFWQVASSATLGSGSILVGTVMALTSISAGTGAQVDGRLLAQNGSVTLQANTIAVAICQTVGNGISVAQVQAALIQSAQTVNLNSAPGLTSIYALGFAQFDTEVFSLQQRFADIRAGLDTDRVPRERSPSSGKSMRDGKSVSDGKSLADGKSISAGTS
ncbi:MAG: ice-binding family protein, partial [Chthoniobacteraceae bacterium]